MKHLIITDANLYYGLLCILLVVVVLIVWLFYLHTKLISTRSISEHLLDKVLDSDKKILLLFLLLRHVLNIKIEGKSNGVNKVVSKRD